MTNKSLRDGRDMSSSTDPATASAVREDAQPTPGPWTIRHDFNVFGADRLVASAGGHASNVRPFDVDAENRANARLIAAAPDLLDALKGMLDQPEDAASYDAMLELAIAAINKAEGRA